MFRFEQKMFDVFDHVYGAVAVRVHRFLQRLKNRADISFIDSSLAVGGACSIENLVKKQIQSILDLRDESFDDPDELRKHSMKYLRIRIQESSIPSLDEAEKAANWIKFEIQKGRKIFVHCNLGRGRGPLMIVLYLITQGDKAQSAIKMIKEKRSYTYLNKEQLGFVERFENRKSKC